MILVIFCRKWVCCVSNYKCCQRFHKTKPFKRCIPYHQKKNWGHRTSKIVKSRKSHSKHCSFYYLACALMLDVACEFACAAKDETISAIVLNTSFSLLWVSFFVPFRIQFFARSAKSSGGGGRRGGKDAPDSQQESYVCLGNRLENVRGSALGNAR